VPKTGPGCLDAFEDKVLGQLAGDVAALGAAEHALGGAGQGAVVTVASAVPLGEAALAEGFVLDAQPAQAGKHIGIEIVALCVARWTAVEKAAGVGRQC